jgi:hypothetical protein
MILSQPFRGSVIHSSELQEEVAFFVARAQAGSYGFVLVLVAAGAINYES